MTLAPQLAEEAELATLDRLINDPRYVGEQKCDGHRLILTGKAGKPPVALTRNGDLYSKAIPKNIEQMVWPTDGLAIDGELVGNTFWAFDLPLVPGQQNLPLHLRRTALEVLILTAPFKHPFRLLYQARTPDEKRGLADATIANNSEGLVFKRVDSFYRMGGRTTDWLKVKYTTTADCVVKGVRVNGKESIDLMVYDDDGNEVEVGRTSLLGKEKRTAVQKGDVVEMRYLYLGANGRLYQPTLLRIRTDKRPDECRTRQLKLVNKEILEAL